ncbi:hypothetical protein LX16_3915 [Stackebrandtia albiflava]|uniref:Uncharacterized protein n=1 Tax=Stackebrandtia albiflava TaxID=406432 RepID=A0A562UY57_9ACTN|nr:hypothetical protein [Stackebrandtia albiflava]TWJ10498.1 hypothetical protein LX16_3915 [Stackebrandtia albiflava]
MSGQWRHDGPSTPDRIRAGAGATLNTARSPRAALVAVAAVAVVLVAALIWATVSFGGDGGATVADPARSPSASPSPEPQTSPTTPAAPEGPVPDGDYQIRPDGGDTCLVLSEHPDGLPDRFVVAGGTCDDTRSHLALTAVDAQTVRLAFLDPGFTEFCLQPDGPGLADDTAKPEDLYYFAPYSCDAGQRLQEFTLVADGDLFRIQTAAGQCLTVFTEWSLPAGDGVGTAPCDPAEGRTFAFTSL